MEHKIEVEPGTTPIKDRYRPIPPALKDNLKKQLNEWLERGIIEPSTSPWSSNLVAVKKKNGDIRWCTDWRSLNSVTVKDAYPMPSIAATLDNLAGSTIFSNTDLRGAFNTVDIAEEDRGKTAFATPFGLFQNIRLGFGLTGGPSTYCRLVAKVMEKVPPTEAVTFLDDSVVHSKDFKQHLVNLRKTLQAYRDAGLKLSPAKCAFFRTEIVYLGHTISSEGLRPTSAYKQAVEDCQLPRTKSEGRSFVGLVGYYRNSIPDFSILAKPWTDVIGSTTKEAERTPLTVTKEMEDSFHELKKRLCTAPVLGFPYFKGPKAGVFILDTDFRKGQISGILSQMQEGVEVPIMYGSRKLNKSQENYGSTKGELYSGMFFMRRFEYYLKYGKKFIWRTDNSALKHWQSMRQPPDVIGRWLDLLCEYPHHVEHRPGIKHVNADALSRLEGARELTQEEMQPLELQEMRLAPLLGLSKEEIVHMQEQDASLKEIRKWVENGIEDPPKLEVEALPAAGKDLWGHASQLIIGADQLLRLQLPDDGLTMSRRTPVCLPEALYEQIIKAVHVQGGHMATDKTLGQLSKLVYFPRMRAQVADTLQLCLACQAKTRPGKDQRHTLVAPLYGFPFEKIHVDFVGPMNKGTVTGARHILTVRDNFSRWMEAFPVKDTKAEGLIHILERDIFSRFGPPEWIHTDSAAVFNSNLFKALGEVFQIKLTQTGGFNPKGNARVERVHKDLAAILRAAQAEEGLNWEEALPAALYALRTNVNDSTGLAPYQILFGRDPSTPLDLLFRGPEEEEKGQTAAAEYKYKLTKTIQRAQEFARGNMHEAVRRQRRAYNKERKLFLPGTAVWLFTPASLPNTPRKLQSFWSGPWMVCPGEEKETMRRITPHPDWAAGQLKKSKVVSIDRLKLYKSANITENIKVPEDGSDLLMEHDKHAEGPFTSFRRSLVLPKVGKHLSDGEHTSSSESDSSDDDDNGGGGGGQALPGGHVAPPGQQAPGGGEGDQEQPGIQAPGGGGANDQAHDERGNQPPPQGQDQQGSGDSYSESEESESAPSLDFSSTSSASEAAAMPPPRRGVRGRVPKRRRSSEMDPSQLSITSSDRSDNPEEDDEDYEPDEEDEDDSPPRRKSPKKRFQDLFKKKK